MTNLILSSNFSGNKLQGVGEATLQDETIYIRAESNTTVTLLRDVNKVVLLKANIQEQITNGQAKPEDVYTLENGDQKLIIKVESKEVHHETNLFINPDPIVDATSTKRKTTLTVGVLILTLLIVSVVFGVKQKNLKQFNTESEIKLNTAIADYENKTRESFVNAKEIATKLKEDGYKNEKLDELLKNINENESEILGEIKPEVKDLLDLTLQINGFSGNKLASTGEIMFVFDESEKNIVQVDVNGKNAKIVAKKDDLKDTKQIASYEDKLFLDKLDGVYEIDSNSLFYLYSANIYMIDRGNSQIYRFSGNGKTFGDKTDWLAPGIEADFSKVIDMTIDGSIWLLSSSGKVTKFTNGNPINIQMTGIVSPLENPTAIYTNEDNKYVYILDKNEGRVVVLEKNGNFKVQYLNDEIKNAADLVVSEKEGKIILLAGSKLMYFEPK
ncbi:MAG: hypothetical protein ACD_19C00014G0004 [uncultured bacterium]|nr:MAG: hypothetical protein ACD_19C00014G0004 [uncultured bacterium]